MIHWRRFFSRKLNILGLALVMLFVLMAALAPLLAPPAEPGNPWPFKGVARSSLPLPPDEDSLLGTAPEAQNLRQYGPQPPQDAANQWDVYHTLIWGSRSALRFGLMVTLITAVVGIIIGVVSGYVGGTFGALTMRLTDAFLAFPAIAGIWVIQRALYSNIYNPFGDTSLLSGWEAVLFNGRIDPVMLALIFFSWMPYARLMNAQVRQARQSEFVLAARSMGASDPHIIWRHILPNTFSPAVVLAARDVGGMVILASAFIFIGFSGNVAWGTMLVAGRDYVIGLAGNPFEYWWVFVPISLALILFGIGWNLLGDGLNSLFNPRER